ncbi:hypothetical protein E1B28_000194 [Marasmius oreades]|uniref:ER-bound oxygenase mpaB/mpaB'/Rubber oxygenase catalytic domain-containing protein n=1 Tax=Marasmius oreades TaxID=181124 RepID=A0A9P7V0Y6_9AGAR|nr:uncharacterized protein E1B28_000194 [Marasmius oreades]KAG7098227.1 hypothetical protein E1B28_000194 [Marasmius oreades]
MFSTFPICCLAIYLLIVRICRYRRVNRTSEKYAGLDLDTITPQNVQQIVHDSSFYDAPMTMLLGTQAALFKVFVVPTIASLLLKTGELTDGVRLNKRIADASTLITTFISNPSPPRSSTDDHSDPRAAIAIARVNYLHGKYSIRNEDLLYNLALFIMEPVRYTARFNWRPHTSLEKKAIFILWTDIGRRMGIEENITPSESAYQLSHITIERLLVEVPSFLGLKYLAYNVFLTLLDDRTRNAMRLPAPNRTISLTTCALFRIRAWTVHHLCLPRLNPALWVQMNPNPICPSADGIPRMHAFYPGPYYFPEPTGYFAVKFQQLLLAVGLKHPDNIPGKKWRSEGYRLEELGPGRYENEGHEQVLAAASQMQGCPITGPWSLEARKGREKVN